MTAEDAERWDARYAGRPTARSLRPDAIDDDIEAMLPTSGRALDIACGDGAQSIWLAERGLRVVALDVSGVAIERARDAHVAAGVADRIDARVVDLDDGLPVDGERFGVIVCQRFRAPHLYEPIVNLLEPGGIAVVTVLSQTGAAEPGPFHAPAGELGRAVDRPDTELLRHVEGDGQESVVVRSRRREPA